MKRREPLSIDLTPLVDVVFILLIFFIVTSVFKKEELALMLDLPSSDAKELSTKQMQTTIELDKNNLALNGDIIEFNELEKQLKLIKNKNKAIIIRIDKQVVYDRVVQLLNLLQKNDLNNLAMVTKE